MEKLGGKNVNINRIIDWTVLSILGVFCYCYSIFWSNFAELNIQFPFLNFPIFVGEMLLGFCIIMFFIKWKNSPIQLNRWHYLLFAYMLFVLFKAFYGYFEWGPLAFRNAALFYYPLFIVIGYYFYDSKFFKNRFVRYTILSLLIITVFLRQGYKTFYFGYLMLTLLLFMEIKRRKLRYILIISFVVICYTNLLITLLGGRNVLVSSLVGYTFLSVVIVWYFLNLKAMHKRIILLFLFVLLVIAFWSISGNKAAARSLVDIKAIFRSYKAQVERIKAREKYFSFADPKVRVYQRNDSYWLWSATDVSPQPPSGPQPEPEPQLQPKPVAESKAKFLDEEEVRSILQNIDKGRLVELAASGVKERIVSSNSDDGQYSFTTNPAVEDKEFILYKEPFQEKEFSAGKLKTVDKKELIDWIAEKYAISRQVQGDNVIVPTNMYLGNILYRLFMWQDMLEELFRERKIFGLDFGKPFRSKKLEISRFDESWKTRVGWVEPHNAYIHMIYRAGIGGILFIIAVVGLFIKMVVAFIRTRNIKGIFLTSVLLYWMTVSNFMVILELPHWAIPFWCLFGMVYKYKDGLKWECKKERE